MKAIVDPGNVLAQGLAAVRSQFQVPASFPPPVLAAAEAAAKRTPTAHVDRTDRVFVTLDPARSVDLDQAFAIERSGGDLLLSYAIADVAWFVDDGDALDVEAWKRGTTLYLPDGKAGLYPPVLSEGAASLLPAGPRPAVIFTVRVAPDGAVRHVSTRPNRKSPSAPTGISRSSSASGTRPRIAMRRCRSPPTSRSPMRCSPTGPASSA